ncbi:FAD binding domain-containing protein [Amycolatopsis anabasis]|uniref:FAD binding domain-containing protein n=1 Tax=Amycolatopsis anabasis TaxID=1840409 RepID=UPI00131B8432|nr:xanthine dehydrogenase family protein subunit M [Amycolatopsis anabasis]
MRPFAYTRAHSVAMAVETVAADPAARFLAGGTELLNLVREGQEAPNRLVDIGALPLTEVRADARRVRIGALAPLVHEHPEIRRRFPVLAEAGGSAASPQVRNMATPGGNLLQRTRCAYYREVRFPCNRRVPGSGCAALSGVHRNNAILGGSEHCIAVHPSDLAVALTALDAVVRTRGPAGERAIPIEELYLLPGDQPHRETALAHGELITAIDVPATAFAARSHYLKVRDRASFAFALVSVAVALELRDGVVHDVRIALGGVAPRPWRARAAEHALRGRRFDDTARAAAGRAATEGATPREHNGFKVPLTERAVLRALSEVDGGR